MPKNPILDDFQTFPKDMELSPRPPLLWWLMTGVFLHAWICNFPEYWLNYSVVPALYGFILISLFAVIIPAGWGLKKVFQIHWRQALAYWGAWLVFGGLALMEDPIRHFYLENPFKMNAVVLLLLTIALQTPHSPHPALWQGLRTLARAYLLTWCLGAGLVWLNLLGWYGALAIGSIPLTAALGMVWTQTQTAWGHLSSPDRLLWLGLWGSIYVLGMSTVLHWWVHLILVIPNFPLAFVAAYEDWAYFSDLVKGSGLLLLAAVGLTAGYRVIKTKGLL